MSNKKSKTKKNDNLEKQKKLQTKKGEKHPLEELIAKENRRCN